MEFKKMNIIWNSTKYTIIDYINFKAAYEGMIFDKVLITMRRTPELLFAICMCLEKRITFIPVDPTYPSEYIQYIIDNAKPSAILTDVELHTNYSKNIETPNLYNNNIAYILYTSGTTGTPKGVEISIEGLMNFLEGVSELIDFSPTKRMACITTISFDIFLLESIGALYNGLTVVLANEDEQRNPKLMAKMIQNEDVDMVQVTPSRMQLLLNYDKELHSLKNVKEIMVGGEPFPLSLLRILKEKTTAHIYNMYGPTETTIWSTVSELTNKDRIDIGYPIKNTEVYIVSENLSILPHGQVGEICISGKGLARGYMTLNELTLEKFIYLPQIPETRVYRTGDIGRYLPDGQLEYLGRIDNQIKIRGHRIEPEEIEMHINQFNGIKQSIVIALETSETETILEAYYTSENNVSTNDIINFLFKKIPQYMIPSVFKRVESFINTFNGKIDRKKIFDCIEIKTENVAEINKLNSIQKQALEIIKGNLSNNIADGISSVSEFSNIGLDSLNFIRIVVALEVEFDFEFDENMLLIAAFPTVKSLIEYVESKAIAVGEIY